MNARSSWLAGLVVLSALLLAFLIYRPRVVMTVEPPRDPVTRARCLERCTSLLRSGHPGLSGVSIHHVAGTDLIRIQARGLTRWEARAQMNTATAFLDEQARQAHKGRVDKKIEEARKASEGMAPRQQYVVMEMVNLRDGMGLPGEWIIRDESVSGW